jgi:hypothetical protein
MSTLQEIVRAIFWSTKCRSTSPRLIVIVEVIRFEKNIYNCQLMHKFGYLYLVPLFKKGPLMVAQWLRYCATNRKVAGSIPDGVIGIFHLHNPSDRTIALGSTQPLTEMSTRSISWG